MTEADGEINQDFINCYNKMVLYFQLPGTQRNSSRTGSKQHCQGLHSAASVKARFLKGVYLPCCFTTTPSHTGILSLSFSFGPFNYSSSHKNIIPKSRMKKARLIHTQWTSRVTRVEKDQQNFHLSTQALLREFPLEGARLGPVVWPSG